MTNNFDFSRRTVPFTFGCSNWEATLVSRWMVCVNLVSPTVEDVRTVNLDKVSELDPWGLEAKAIEALELPEGGFTLWNRRGAV